MSKNSTQFPIWTRLAALILIMLMLVGLFAYTVKDLNPKDAIISVPGYKPWTEETVALMNRLPVQDGGRVKPFSTHAAFTMMRMRGDRTINITDGSSTKKIAIDPSEWMMDCLFRPTLAVQMPTFRVDNSAAIDAIGIASHSRRDRYSYKELEDGLPKLFELGQSYEKIAEKQRDVLQKQVIDLAYNVRNYQFLIGYFSFARSAIEMKGANPDGSSRFTDFSTVMATAPMIIGMAQESQATGKPIPPNLESLLQQVLDGANFSKFGLVIVPPDEESDKNWRSVGDRIMDVMSSKLKDNKIAIEDIKVFEESVRAVATSEPEFRAALQKSVDRFTTRAESRKEYRAIGAENKYNHYNFILKAMIWFTLALVSVVLMWLLHAMNVKPLLATICHYLALLCSVTGCAILITAIVMRSYIMWRPPVGNLYDTILFICAASVLILFLIEGITRTRVATSLAAIVGLGLVLLARSYEVGDAKDHMDPLVAVLNSNYWLTTHVITVTLGYAAGLLTAFLSISYVLMRGLGLGTEMKRFLKHINVATYGCICLTLFLSLVGTVLGGIWANDSWGRFWGWDPKENGALMIVLWSLVLLHARLGGIIRDWGLHICSIFMGCIVTFSWWHVNFLGVGLHNYGFTAGKGTIWVFYGVMLMMMLFAVVLWALEQISKNRNTDNDAQEKPLAP